MVSTDLSNIVPLAFDFINPVETFTSVYNLYLYQTRLPQLQMNKKEITKRVSNQSPPGSNEHQGPAAPNSLMRTKKKKRQPSMYRSSSMNKKDNACIDPAQLKKKKKR